jgi:putative ABC transport system permease protein
MLQLGGYEEANNVVRGLKTAACEIQANYPNCAQINHIVLEKGRFLNDLDIKEKRKICVIGPRVAELLFNKGEEVLGEYIRVNGVYFRIVGLTKVTTGAGAAHYHSFHHVSAGI